MRARNEAETVSHTTIYTYVNASPTLRPKLRRRGKKYLVRTGPKAVKGPIKNRVSIRLRPKEVEEKQRIGDVEVDTMVGAKHRGAIVTIVDRRSKLVRLCLIKYKTAAATADALITALAPIKRHLHTITSDNGAEFADHEEVSAALGVGFFFADPYCSWQRGLNENTNGLIRQYFPKGTDFSKITNRQILHVEQRLNNRPRKTLGYRTPNEVFSVLTALDRSF